MALPRTSGQVIDLWHSDTYILTTWEMQVKNWQDAFRADALVSMMVSTETTKTVDRGSYESAKRHRVVTASAKHAVTRRRSTPTYTYPVPILYSAFNTNADYSTDMRQEVGGAWLFDKHWAMSASVSTASTTAIEAAAAAAAVVETTETRSEGEEEEGDRQGEAPPTTTTERPTSPLNVPPEAHLDNETTLMVTERPNATHSSSDVVGTAMDTTATTAAQDETGTVAKKMQVTALQLCGLEAFSVFDKAERDAIQRLLVVSDDALAPLHDYHERILDVSPEEASHRVACLRPEYHLPEDNGGAPPVRC